MHILTASHSVPSSYLNKHFLPMVPLKIIDKILVEKFEEQPLFFKKSAEFLNFDVIYSVKCLVSELMFVIFFFSFKFSFSVLMGLYKFAQSYFFPSFEPMTVESA